MKILEPIKEIEPDFKRFQSIIEDKTTEKYYFIPPAPLLILSEDALRLCLINHITRAEKRNNWVPVLSNFFVILITLITCNFKDFIISKDMWESIFVLSGIGTFFLFIYTFVRFSKKSKTIDDIIIELKKSK